MLINQKDMDFWIKSNLNVLFKGKHGAGKTARVIEAFERHQLKWKYFSASTMDPWVDFVGIPKEKSDGNGHHYIDFVRPRDMEDDSVEAIFFDEFNRCPKKVLNAVMELIQFKSINGRKFNNLRFIWAAVNMNEADEQTYSVESIDPAQLDRFQIHVDVPYKLDSTYFIKKFGKEIAASTAEWWEQIPVKLRDDVSPRRVDYALDIWKAGGNISYVLPKPSNPHSLLALLSSGPVKDKFSSLVKSKFADADVAFKDVNFSDWVARNISDEKIYKHMPKIIDYINDDVVSRSVDQYSNKSKFLESVYSTPKGQKIMDEIKTAGVASSKVLLRVNKVITKLNPNKQASTLLDIENNFDTSKMTSSSARKKAFDYLVGALKMGLQVSLQELMYITSTLDYIKSHTTKPTFKSKYQTEWPQVIAAMQQTIDAALAASASNPTPLSPEMQKVFADLKAWQTSIL